MRDLKKLLAMMAVATTGVFFGVSAVAQAAYPNKPIRLVIPQPPGGASDIYTRVVAQKMSEILGQQIVIDNRPGAGGNIGADVVAKAAPDGYTILVTPSATLTVNPGLYVKMPFDSMKDFAPVTNLVELPFLLVVNPQVPIHNMKELIDSAKKNPGKLNFASAGAGQMIHLAMELVKAQAKIDITHVPYKGGGQALPDVMSGQVEMMFLSIPATMPFVKEGKLRAIGISSPKRSTVAPDIPAIAETLPGFDASLWIGLFAPAGTPPAIVQKLNAAAKEALFSPEVQKKFQADGSVAVASTPEQVTAQMTAEAAKWAKIMKDIGIKPE